MSKTPDTFTICFLSNGKWYIHAFGISREVVADVLTTLWEFEKRDGVKVEPDSEGLKKMAI